MGGSSDEGLERLGGQLGGQPGGSDVAAETGIRLHSAPPSTPDRGRA